MTWADIYLLCFLVGFALSAVAFIAGNFHLPHLPHMHLHGQFHGPAAGHGAAGHGPGGHGSGRTLNEVSYFNFGTVSGFLAWFGGTGYLLARYSAISFFLALGISVMSGLGGAAIIFLFLAKVMAPHDKYMDPADYDMIGVLGTVTSAIRADGTGEMIFSRDGARRAAFARSDAGEAIAKGTEVVITRYEKGIAYVRRWEELADAADSRS
jgi:membrane protein implicated in regulation of membrane protease activity